MEKSKKPSNPVCYTPSSEPFRIYPFSRVFPKKLTVDDLIKKSPTFYGTEVSLQCSQELASDLTLNQRTAIHTLYPIPVSRTSILSTHLRSVLPTAGFQTNIVYGFLIFPICAACSIHLILLDLFTVIIFDGK
jgi:hypothetical protein